MREGNQPTTASSGSFVRRDKGGRGETPTLGKRIDPPFFTTDSVAHDAIAGGRMPAVQRRDAQRPVQIVAARWRAPVGTGQVLLVGIDNFVCDTSSALL